MVICTICKEEIPRSKRCAHGKKPWNCGGLCLTAYIHKHEGKWQATKSSADGILAGSVEQAKIKAQSEVSTRAGEHTAHQVGSQEEADTTQNKSDASQDEALADDGNTSTKVAHSDVPTGQASESNTSTASQNYETDAITAEEEAALSADIAQMNAEAAQGMLEVINRMHHMPTFSACRNCEKPPVEGKKIRKCKGCRVTGYCGPECQRKHWQAGHKRECKAWKEIGEAGQMDQAGLMRRLEELK